MDRKIQMTPGELAQGLREGVPLRVLDVRSREEWEHTHLAEATHVTQELVQEILNDWAKDTPMVLYCHRGQRSMDAAAYFIGHGFTNVRSLKGGIDAWSLEVDSKIPRYQLASPSGRKAHLM
jgi:rhodanese-related sulfurtransferase